MTHDEISKKVRTAQTLSECEAATELLLNYLGDHPDDDDMRDEGSGLYMKMTALQQTAQSQPAERAN